MAGRWLAGVLLMVVAASVQAEMYRWVDAKGVVNYGEQPPEGVKAVPIGGRGSVSVVPAYKGQPEPPAPPPPSPTEQRIDRLEQQLSAERAARRQMQADEEARRAEAIRRCQENHGVNCENAYEQGGDGLLISPPYRLYRPYRGYGHEPHFPDRPVGNTWGNVDSGSGVPRSARPPHVSPPPAQPAPPPAPRKPSPTVVPQGAKPVESAAPRH